MPRKTAQRVVVHLFREVVASMRPRPDAAENQLYLAADVADVAASMRPRPDAAENMNDHVDGSWTQPHSFNEAAARCRGKPSS